MILAEGGQILHAARMKGKTPEAAENTGVGTAHGKDGIQIFEGGALQKQHPAGGQGGKKIEVGNAPSLLNIEVLQPRISGEEGILRQGDPDIAADYAERAKLR